MVKKKGYYDNYRYHIEDRSTKRNCVLNDFFIDEMRLGSGANTWLPIFDDPDGGLGGNSCLIFREDRMVGIKSMFDVMDIGSDDIYMPMEAARKLLIQMERVLVERPDIIDVVWHEDGSATFEWESTCIRQALVKKAALNLYVVDHTDYPEDNLLVEYLNILLRLIHEKSREELAWVWAPTEKLLDLGTIQIESQLTSSVEGFLLIKSKPADNISVRLYFGFFHLILSHAKRIVKEQPSLMYLKWYRHGVAFEWESNEEENL